MAGLTPLGRFDWERIIRRIHNKPLPRCEPGRVHIPWDVRSLLLLYATYGAADGTRVYPGDKRIIRIIGKSSTTMRRWRETPVRLGLLMLVRHGGGSGVHRQANEYRLTVPDDLLDTFCLLDPDTEDLPPTTSTVPIQAGIVKVVAMPELCPPGEATVPAGERTVPEIGGHCAHSDRHPSRDQGDQPQTKHDRYVGNARASTPTEDDPEHAKARHTLTALPDFGAALITGLRAALPNGAALSERDARVTAAELVRARHRVR